MPEVAYKDNHDEMNRPAGAYELIRSLDKNVRDISSELYVLKRDTSREFTDIKQRLSKIEASEAMHDKNIDILKNDVTELKQEVKELRSDVSDIKGDIKAIAAGFGAAQNRFNWGLIILGIFIALIQLLK